MGDGASGIRRVTRRRRHMGSGSLGLQHRSGSVPGGQPRRIGPTSQAGWRYPSPSPDPIAQRPDYLVGNPGWQGSNTFVSLPLIRKAGGFRGGLMSLNDRDLAIRLLRLSDTQPTQVARWTATWYADTPGALSSRGGKTKLVGLRQFWSLYGAEMTPAESHAFFTRAETLFGFNQKEIRVPVESCGISSITLG
jgi:hypothetical protein